MQALFLVFEIFASRSRARQRGKRPRRAPGPLVAGYAKGARGYGTGTQQPQPQLSQPQLFPQPQLLPQLFPQPQPPLEPQPQKMMMRIRMIHRQLLPPQPLLQHIHNYLLSEMETVWRSQSILCPRCPDVLPGKEIIFCPYFGSLGAFPRMVRVGLQHRSSMSDMVAAGSFRAPPHRAQKSSTEL